MNLYNKLRNSTKKRFSLVVDHLNFYFRIEKNIVIFLNKIQWAPLDLASNVISNIKVLVFLWLVVIAYAVSRNVFMGISLAIKLAALFALHYLISECIIKYGAKRLSLLRRRPYAAYPNEIRSIGRNFSDSSFPSSHMASITGGFVILYAAFPTLLPALIVFLVLLAFSRLHNGMHYPSDILAGIILGIIYGDIILAISRALSL